MVDRAVIRLHTLCALRSFQSLRYYRRYRFRTYLSLHGSDHDIRNRRAEAEILVPLAKGEKLGAFGLTEPGAGTDAQGQQTKAVLDGDEWVLNGSKCFITNGKYADTYIVIAVTGTVEKRGKMQKRDFAFIVEKVHRASLLVQKRRRWVSADLQHMNLFSQTAASRRTTS